MIYLNKNIQKEPMIRQCLNLYINYIGAHFHWLIFRLQYFWKQWNKNRDHKFRVYVQYNWIESLTFNNVVPVIHCIFFFLHLSRHSMQITVSCRQGNDISVSNIVKKKKIVSIGSLKLKGYNPKSGDILGIKRCIDWSLWMCVLHVNI